METQQELENNRQIEMYKTVIQSGHLALKSLFIMNGGAAVAMAAFLGQAADKFDIDKLGGALLWFALGTFFACLSQGFNYFTAFIYADTDDNSSKLIVRFGNGLNVTTIIIAVLGFLTFCIGLFNAYQAFSAP